MSNVNIDEYKKQLETFMLDFDNRLGQQAIFQKIKEATGVRPAHVALAAIVFVALFALFGVGSHALWYVTRFPLYLSAFLVSISTDCSRVQNVHYRFSHMFPHLSFPHIPILFCLLLPTFRSLSYILRTSFIYCTLLLSHIPSHRSLYFIP